MTGLLPRLLARSYPACGTDGTGGLPVPPPLDFATLVRPRPKNACLAAPPGMKVMPDILTRLRHVPPVRLFAALREIAEAQPRTTLHVLYKDLMQAHYVQRSHLCNFPDLITLQATPDSMPMLYSRSVYGQLDFGVNRQRLVAWLTALDTKLPNS